MKLRVVIVALAIAMPSVAWAQGTGRAEVANLKVTVLSTMLVGDSGAHGIGEWGFAALLEADGHKVLIDTGARPEAVWKNAEEMGVDLSDITDVVLTHNHFDHTGGLLTLRRAVMAKNPQALSRVHVPAGIFTSRLDPNGRELGGLLPIKSEFEKLAGALYRAQRAVRVVPRRLAARPGTARASRAKLIFDGPITIARRSG
jgi:7,8-dihydropterin-6-yl-methyl-4-(beta-D-ribofuranosyl)aminobenzene 5'-phosphate synthase